MARRESKGSERAAELLAAYERSGVTREAFCAAMGIAVTTLDYYRQQVKLERSRQVGLVPVEVK